MAPEEQIDWNKIIEDDITSMQFQLSELRTEVLKMQGREGYEYLKPIRHIIYEALMEVYHKRNESIAAAENILKFMDGKP